MRDIDGAASVDLLASRAVDGWRIDETLVVWSGGTPLAPLPVVDLDQIPVIPLLRAAAATATVHPDNLRCFTLPFWRSARPDLTPVLAWSQAPGGDAGPFLSPEAAATRWRLSVLAALDGMAGGPAVVVAFDDLDGATDLPESAPADDVPMLGADASADSIVAALEALTGKHETFPAVVRPGVVAQVAEELAEERADTPVVGSMQLYWSTSGHAFNEEDSFSGERVLRPFSQLVRTPIPNVAVESLRLDPINQECRLAISAIRIIVAGQVVRTFAGGRSLLDECQTADLEADPDDPGVLIAVTADPQIELDISLDADRGVERFIEVEVAAVPRQSVGRDGTGHDDRSSGEALLSALEAAMPSGPVADGPAASERAVDLTQWAPEGFVEVDGWGMPESDDPVLSSPLLDLPPTRELVVRMAVTSDEPVAATLYFAAAGAEFTQSNALHFQPSGDGELHDYAVDVPDFIGALPRERAQLIRFDPVDRVVPFKVASLTFVERAEAEEAVRGEPHQSVVDLVAGRDVILSIGGTNYLAGMGGSERRIGDEAGLAREHGYAYVHVWPMVKSDGFGDRSDLKLDVSVDGTHIRSCLSADIEATVHQLDVAEVRVHHLMGWTWPVVGSLLSACDAPIRYCAHDFYAICPQFTLLRNRRDFCDAPPVSSMSCGVCASQPIRLQVQPRVSALLHAVASRLTIQCPSESAAQLYRREFPQLADRVVVHPHERLLPVPAAARDELPDRLRLAFVGVASAHKGWSTWCRLRSDPRLQETYEFVHLGMAGTHDTDRVVSVDFRSGGSDAMEQALRGEDIHLALIWSQWPETFSFTTIESIAAGCLVVASDASGNAAQMVRDHGAGVVLPNRHDALVDFLLRTRTVRDLVEARRGSAWTIERDAGPLPAAREA